jgi:hypothetical protein
MKNVIKFRHAGYLLLMASGIALLNGCSIYTPYTQELVTVPDIIQMSKEGVTSKDIIRDIRKSHTVYTLKADQLAKLQGEGVSDSVINYMEKTHLDAVRQDQVYQNYGYYGPGWGGYWYGGPYFGGYGGYMGWGWGPGIIVENRIYHGGGHNFRGSRGGGRH